MIIIQLEKITYSKKYEKRRKQEKRRRKITMIFIYTESPIGFTQPLPKWGGSAKSWVNWASFPTVGLIRLRKPHIKSGKCFYLCSISVKLPLKALLSMQLNVFFLFQESICFTKTTFSLFLYRARCDQFNPFSHLFPS